MSNVIAQVANKVVEQVKQKVDESIKRSEISKLVAKANKRIARIEKNNLEDSPAYQGMIERGEPRFSVRGKDHNQLQKEVARLHKFLESETSTVRGINRVLKTMAVNTGIKYKNLAELRAKSAKFFELQSKVEQYLRTVEDMASAIGYQKIWETINKYVKAEGVDLKEAGNDIDKMVKIVTDMLKTPKASIVHKDSSNWYQIK